MRIVRDIEKGTVDPMIYGHFLEHFHRQIYGGVYDPGNPLSDEDGFRTDVIEALRAIRTPVIRWPGGCFVSSYHWYKGVGKDRTPVYDISWRVREPNTFGTDEFVKLCRKIGCEPYICTNAGTGTPEEMSNWVEYCNLPAGTEFSDKRKETGTETPYNVKYWSIGNENYGAHEIGRKSVEEWGSFVEESAKMMLHTDPKIELSAAALTDTQWNYELLKRSAPYLKWISIHGYWDGLWQVNDPAGYEQSIAQSDGIEGMIRRVRGLLEALGYENRIRIAFDEWNLRGWHHPGIHQLPYAEDEKDYLPPRDENDVNSTYTMADAVFAGCFLNSCIRNCDIVGMANFAPVVNTRGCIFTHKDGIVLRPTYHVFRIFTGYMGDRVVYSRDDDSPVTAFRDKHGNTHEMKVLDTVCAIRKDGAFTVSAVNRDGNCSHEIRIPADITGDYRTCIVNTVNGPSADSYNDIDRDEVRIKRINMSFLPGRELPISLEPHSVNIIEFR